jgi:hypothetical protein
MILNESMIVMNDEKMIVEKFKANPIIFVQEDDATVKLEISDCELEKFQEAYTYHK